MSKPTTKFKSAGSSISKPNGVSMHKMRVSFSAARAKKTIDQEADEQASKILAAIHEADEIHAGRKKGKSFDQFLKEI